MADEAIIGFNDAIVAITQTIGSTNADFPFSNLLTQLTTHKWKPAALPSQLTVTAFTAQTIEYIGIAAHDLATHECSVEFETYDGSWTSRGIFSPTDNKAIMATGFTATSVTQVRMTITELSGAPDTFPAIGVWMAGTVLEMPYSIYGGHTPITLARDTKKIVNETEGGQFAGNSIIREGVGTSYEWKHLTPAFYRASFDPFVVAARDKAFFIKWFPDTYALEVGFVWTTNDMKPVNMGLGAGLMSVTMQVKGYTDE